jgi:hypothetical protein
LGSEVVKIKAETQVATSIARTADGHINAFFANFAGLRGGSNLIQASQTGIEVTVKAKSEGHGFLLPFLGEVQTIQSVRHGDALTFILPAIAKGAVFWYEPLN